MMVGCQSQCILALGVFYVILLHRCRHVKGVVELSSSAVAPVCQVGDQLELTCTSSATDHRWEFTVFPESMTYTTLPVSSDGLSSTPPPLTFSSSTITFSRISNQSSIPLISRVVVTPVSSGLNGTVVKCFEGISSTESVATTTIRIIDSQQFELSIRSDPERFSSDGITVNLEWTLLNSIYYQQLLRNIIVSAVPPLRDVVFTESMRAQLVLSYNTLYNVSVTQNSTCERLIRTSFLELNYNKCTNPMELTNALAVDYVDPARDGQTITFSCAPGQTLNGSTQSTCMGNGRWEPDPGDVECIGPDDKTTDDITGSNTTLEPPECMSKETCSRPKSDNPRNSTLGIVLGIIFGLLLPVTIIIVVIFIFILIKKRGSNRTRDPKYQQTIELDSHGDNNYSKDESTLVYADIGQHQAPMKSNMLLLDDNRVEYALLDHTVHNKASTSQESSAPKTDNCPSVNLNNLLIQLRPQVGPKWYEFGEAAGIEKEALDKIAQQCPPDQCIIELFDYWLRNSLEPPTWKVVADVLKAINLMKLALDIEGVYTTGTLPIVVDMNHVPKLDTPEEEPPPPLPERSANLYIDTPSHTVQAGSQVQTSRTAPQPSKEVSAPALPPKPPRMKSTNVSAAHNPQYIG